MYVVNGCIENGGQLNTLTRICKQMIVPYNQLVDMVIVDAATNNVDASTLRTVSIEYSRIPFRITNILKSP
jgi:hypothetical protein